MVAATGGLFVVVAYDVTVDRRRQKLAQRLLDFGERVQYSVFEMDLRSPATYERMLTRVRRTIDAGEDSVRVYRLCPACRESLVCLGVAAPVERAGLVVVQPEPFDRDRCLRLCSLLACGAVRRLERATA